MRSLRVTVAGSLRHFDAAPSESVLDAALAAGLALPHRCRGGNCGECRAQLLSGEVHYPHGAPLGLSEAQRTAGDVLLCQAHARSDLRIDIAAIATADDGGAMRLPCRVDAVEHPGPDVMRIWLRLPAAVNFRFRAGQYVDVLLPGGQRRSFSIASPPHEARRLELHVRRVPGGEFTERLFTTDPRQSLLEIDGPRGNFFYAPGERPLLLIGGGTGLAPLMSMLRHVFERGVPRRMTLYWGVRDEGQLYAHAQLTAWRESMPLFEYVPVLVEPSAAWGGARGWVHAAALAQTPQLDLHEVYAAGPPALISAVCAEFAARGLDAAHLHVDSFDYAPPRAARQSSSAATKS